jgi:hypothetical protein
MSILTIFTWGYWGWGTATQQLVHGIDAVEKSRGYKPPLFVDIRIRRTGRAPGFVGDRFKQTVGAFRYQWLDGLGNLAIKQGGRMRIKDPSAAETLLQLAETAQESGRRVIFFCACEFPGTEYNLMCHRVVVAGLLLEAGRRRKLRMQVVEWPGGEPRFNCPEIQVPSKVFQGLLTDRMSIPLSRGLSLAEMVGLPWGSVVTVRPDISSTGDYAKFITGPARFKNGEWYLPVVDETDREASKAVHGEIGGASGDMRPEQVCAKPANSVRPQCGRFSMLLKCLSIQQPFTELIMLGRKRVENRGWTWMKERNWRDEGSVLLGIHASRKMACVAAEDLDEWFPGWNDGDGIQLPFGSVVGVVELLSICRPADLPVALRGHEFVNRHSDNWCWVLTNPQRLVKPFPATGNARLFNVKIPDHRLPRGTRVAKQ